MFSIRFFRSLACSEDSRQPRGTNKKTGSNRFQGLKMLEVQKHNTVGIRAEIHQN